VPLLSDRNEITQVTEFESHIENVWILLLPYYGSFGGPALWLSACGNHGGAR
jgi:hypothetical protein